jgi:hypothetical protein
MACVVIRNAAFEWIARRDWGKLSQKLIDVANFCDERIGPFAHGFVVGKQVTVLLQCGTTSGGIDDDRVNLLAFKR